MVRKFGSKEAFDRVKVAHRLMPRAEEAGLDKHGWSDEHLDSRRQSSTLRAHRLIRWLDETQGWERAELAYAYLHDAHFVKGALLNDLTILTAAAVVGGADASAADTFLRSDECEAAILAEVDEVHSCGIHSIPTLFIDGRAALSGAADRHEVLKALREAAGSAVGMRRFGAS